MSRGYGQADAPSFGFDRNVLPVVEAVARVARRVWPAKTARNLASRTRATHRAAENWLASSTGMNAEQLAELLRSDIGLELLEEIVGPAAPSWWPTFRVACELDAIERQSRALTERVEALRGGKL